MLLLTALHAGTTWPVTLDFDPELDVMQLSGLEFGAWRKSLSKLARESRLPDVVVIHDILDLDVRTLRTHIRHGYRPVLVIHATRTPEEAVWLAKAMGKPVPTATEWTTRMMRVQNMASEFGRVDVAQRFLMEIYADAGAAQSTEAVRGMLAEAMCTPPPDPERRVLPALSKSAARTGMVRGRLWACRCHAFGSSHR